MSIAELKVIEEALKEKNAYIISSIDGKGAHIGRFKGVSVDAEGDLIIESDIDSISSAVQSNK